MAASRRTAARVTRGAISLSTSSHFPLKPYSYWTKPVALSPGRARLSTKPAPTGSATIANIIGTVRAACNNGPTCALPLAKKTPGASATNAAAYLRVRSAPPSDSRSANCGPRSSPIPAAVAGTPRARPARPDCPQPPTGARRSAASARPAAHAPRAAMRKLRRPEAGRTPAVSIDRIAFVPHQRYRITNWRGSASGHAEILQPVLVPPALAGDHLATQDRFHFSASQIVVKQTRYSLSDFPGRP